jgi:8-oxo-dGTP pyrophosphatase MutT (NUDIX family)
MNKIEKLFTHREQISDKYYIYANVEYNKTTNTYTIQVNSSDYKVTLDNNNKDVKKVYDVRTAKPEYMETLEDIYLYKNQLISAGLIALFNNDKTILIERDDKAPIEANKLQFPAGRCSSTPYITAKKEFLEEVHISTSEKEDINILEEYEYEEIKYKNSKVITTLDGKIVDEKEMLVVHDVLNNTLENYLLLKFDLDIDTLQLKDKEPYGRNIKTINIQNLNTDEYEGKLVNNLDVFLKKFF